jgi:hypothetical protein
LKKAILLSSIILACSIFIGCDDHGIAPPAVLTGIVHLTGTLPDSLAYFWVAVGTNKPPLERIDTIYTIDTVYSPDSTEITYDTTDITYKPIYPLDITLLANYFQAQLPITSDEIPFRIELGPGTYNWIIVAAVVHVDSLCYDNVLGQYTEQGDTSRPKSIVIGWNDSLWIDMYIDVTGKHIP